MVDTFRGSNLWPFIASASASTTGAAGDHRRGSRETSRRSRRRTDRRRADQQPRPKVGDRLLSRTRSRRPPVRRSAQRLLGRRAGRRHRVADRLATGLDATRRTPRPAASVDPMAGALASAFRGRWAEAAVGLYRSALSDSPLADPHAIASEARLRARRGPDAPPASCRCLVRRRSG